MTFAASNATSWFAFLVTFWVIFCAFFWSIFLATLLIAFTVFTFFRLTFSGTTVFEIFGFGCDLSDFLFELWMFSEILSGLALLHVIDGVSKIIAVEVSSFWIEFFVWTTISHAEMLFAASNSFFETRFFGFVSCFGFFATFGHFFGNFFKSFFFFGVFTLGIVFDFAADFVFFSIQNEAVVVFFGRSDGALNVNINDELFFFAITVLSDEGFVVRISLSFVAVMEVIETV